MGEEPRLPSGEAELHDLAHALVQALDAWGSCLGKMLDSRRPSRQRLLHDLQPANPKISSYLLTHWLLGRRMLLDESRTARRVPEVQDADNIARVLPAAVRKQGRILVGLASEIQTYKRQLVTLAGPDWRRAAIEAVKAPSMPNSPVVAAQNAAPPDGEERAGPVDVLADRTDLPDATMPVPPAGTPQEALDPQPPLAPVPVTATTPASPPASGRASGLPVPPAVMRVPARRRWRLAAGMVAVACVVASAGVAGLVRSGSGSGAVGPQSGDPTAPVASTAPTTGAVPGRSATVKALPPLPSAAPATSAGLGGNNRCARPRYVNGVAWMPCTRADGEALVFAVQLTNTGPDPVTVKAKLAYVRAAVEHECPGPWGTGVELTLEPGQTVIGPQTGCTAAKLSSTAFQAKAWVTAPDEPSWQYREMSQTVHIQPDGRTALWADEA
ncbi:hypothetical protein [Kitasatospora aureofaciens]|uniref:hypothetical protein n=1 Tax=Kitasatospora aureofaciens TaxID=1894 RepID=UPI0033D53950